MKLRHDMVQCYVVRPAGGSHELLQLRRAAGDYMGGTWQIIWGHIEPGETAPQTAVRELREETSLEAMELYQLDTINQFYLAWDDSIWMCPGFVAVVAPDAQVFLNEEHDDFRWVPRNQFLAHLMWPGERAAAAEMQREILDNGPAKPHLRIKLGE